MPRMSSSAYAPMASRSASPTVSQTQAAAVGVQGREFNLAQSVAGYGLGGVLDLADTISSSVPGLSHITGANRGDLNRYVTRAIDMPGFNQFMLQNQAGVEATSGIMGVIGAELITSRFTRPAGLLMKGLRKTPYLRRIAALDDQYEAAIMAVGSADLKIASRGTMGGAQYTARATVDTMRFDAATGLMAPVAKTSTRAGFVASAKGLGFLKGARHAAFTETTMAVTLNQNGFLYDDSMGYNMAWMAMGLGVGGGIESAFAAYRVRKFANSDEVRRVFADAVDPEHIEQGRLKWLGKKFEKKALDASDWLGGSYTDELTSLHLMADTLETYPVGTVDNPQALIQNRSALATQHRQEAREIAQKVTTKGIDTDGRTRFSMNSPGFGNHLDLMLKRDPGAMYQAELVGGLDPESNMTAWGVHETRTDRIAERIRETDDQIMSLLSKDRAEGLTKAEKQDLEFLQERARRLDYAEKLVPMAAIDGELMPISEARAFEGFIEPEIKTTALGDREFVLEAVTEAPSGGITLDNQLQLGLPKGKTLDTADHYDIMRAYRLADAAVKKLAATGEAVTLPKKPTWFQLDMAEELLRRTEGRAKVVFPGSMTRESAQVESLAQKAEALKKQRKVEERNIKKADETDSIYEGRASRLRLRYNLPRITAYERGVMGDVDHPLDVLMRGVGEYGPDEFRKMNLDQVLTGVAEVKRLRGDISPVLKSDKQSLYGTSFTFMRDESGKAIKPLLIYKRPFEDNQWLADTLAERIADSKIKTVTTLLNASDAALTQTLADTLINSEDFRLASRPDTLLDTQIQGNILGAAPNTPWGALPKELVSSEWMARDNPTLLAALRLSDTVDRIMRDNMKQAIDMAFGDRLQVLSNPRNAATRTLLDSFHTFRSGWDLKVKPKEMPDGMYGFELMDTAENRRRFKLQYGREMSETGEMLRNPDGGKIVVLDEMGMDIQQRYNMVTSQLVKEKNALLRSMTRNEIREAAHYTPPPNVEGKFMGFVIGPDGRTLPSYTVVEQTQAAFDTAKAAVEARLRDEGKAMGYTFRTQDEISQFANIWDRVEMDMINPGTTAVQPNQRGRGNLTGGQVRVGAFEDSLKWLQDQFGQHGSDVLETLMKEQIQAAKSRRNLARGVTKNKEGKFDQNYRTVYDYYLENLRGRSKSSHEGSIIGSKFRSIEAFLDKGLEQAAPMVSRTWTALTEWTARHQIWDKSEQGRRDFEALSARLGEHMPFKDAAELAERRYAGTKATTTAEITGKVNQISAALMLRIMEVAHPVMNLAGLANAMPAVIRHLQPRSGETTADFANRVGHSAQIFNVKGKPLGVLDMTKIAKRAYARAWSRSSHADYDFMVQRGYLSQEVAEFQRQFGAIEGKKEWHEFFEGKVKVPTAKKAVDWLSVLSDKSEDFSRSWGHMIGLELADELGIAGRETRNMFAHDVANKMIANYSPANRPEVFQGALGAPIGLFQSFIMNYYQRLFRYIETKDARSFATQYATQSALFGVTGLSGWDAMNSFFNKISGGESDPTTDIHSTYKGNTGDILSHGLISSIPKLFGAEGIDLYSRGDTNARVPGVGANPLPGEAIAAKIVEGIQAGAQLFWDANPSLTDTQFAEVLSNMVVNRPLAGMIEQAAAHGNDTDRYGQIVTDTQSGMEAAYRVLGVRSMRQSQNVAAFYADKTAMEFQAAKQDVLRVQTRRIIRDGTLDQNADAIFTQYLQTGGDPRYFRRWLKSNIKAATTPASQRQAERLLKKPMTMDRALRFIDMGVSVDDDTKLPDMLDTYGYPDEFESGTGNQTM